jgi:hypothetical protein
LTRYKSVWQAAATRKAKGLPNRKESQVAAVIKNPAKVIALNSNEDGALAALLYALRDPELLKAASRHMGLALGSNQQEEITQLWGKLYGGTSAEA